MDAVDQKLPGVVRASEVSPVATRVDGKVYAKLAVLSAANRHSEHFFVSVEPENDSWLIRFTPRCKGNASAENPIPAFLSDLVDHQLRREMDELFRPLRQLIAARAFSGIK